MSGLPSQRKIVCAVVALLSAICCFHIPKKSPPRRCPPQPLSAAAVCAIRHCRTQNAARELRHHPPPLGPVSVAAYCRQRRQPLPTDRRHHCFHCHMPRDAFRNPLTGAPCQGAKRWRAKICDGCISARGKLCRFALMLGNAFFNCVKWQCNERQRRW